MPVHLVFQCALSDLIESVKVEGNPTSVREQQAVKAHHQPGLILGGDSRRRADHSRSSGHQNSLPIGGVKRNGHRRQHRAGKVA